MMKQAVATVVRVVGVGRNMKILMNCTVSIVNNAENYLLVRYLQHIRCCKVMAPSPS